jgi:Amt family ammonium transporter
MIDFAGCSVIHMLGGITAFISAFFCGPRLGRFGADGKVHPDWRGHSTTLVVIGTFILWTGCAPEHDQRSCPSSCQMLIIVTNRKGLAAAKSFIRIT